MKPSMLEALIKYNGALPQALAPNQFMLILTIFNHETAPLWTGKKSYYLNAFWVQVA